MIFWYILIGIAVVVIGYLIYRWLHKPEPPQEDLASATNLKSTFIKHLEN